MKQPGARHRGEQIIAVDHLVVEDRRRGTRAVGLQMIEHRLLADVLLVRDLALRLMAREHRGEAGLDGRRA